MPSNLYIALCTTLPVAADTGTTISDGKEVAGKGYRRIQFNSGANWTATQGGTSGPSTGSSGTTSNNSSIMSQLASENWGTIIAVAICDASTGGNVLFFGSLANLVPVYTNQVFEFVKNQLVISLS